MGKYTKQRNPDCLQKENISALNPWMKDGKCQEQFFNFECGWDHGDYPDYSEDIQFSFSNYNAPVPSQIGNGFCECGIFNAEGRGFHYGDYKEFSQDYPGYDVEFPIYVGNGDCNGGEYNTRECGWDGGEYRAIMVGDGWCNGGEYNTEECAWDGGDSIEFNKRYPDCKSFCG